MSLSAVCPGCNVRLAVPDELEAKRLTCPKCNCAFKLNSPPKLSSESLEQLFQATVRANHNKFDTRKGNKRWTFTFLLVGVSGLVVMGVGYIVATVSQKDQAESFAPRLNLISTDPWVERLKEFLLATERDCKFDKVRGVERVEGALAKAPNEFLFPVIEPNDLLCISDKGDAVGPPEWLESYGYEGVCIKYEQRLANTRAVRIEYRTYEGFSDWSHRDEIFIVELLPPNRFGRKSRIERVVDFRIGK